MWIAVLVTMAFAVGRFAIEPRLNLPTETGSYEAFVHLWVGGLVGFWWSNRDKRYLGLAAGITVFEVVMFIVQKRWV